jgi:hypothetical protein
LLIRNNNNLSNFQQELTSAIRFNKTLMGCKG